MTDRRDPHEDLHNERGALAGEHQCDLELFELGMAADLGAITPHRQAIREHTGTIAGHAQQLSSRRVLLEQVSSASACLPPRYSAKASSSHRRSRYGVGTTASVSKQTMTIHLRQRRHNA
ncbi:hypothetical protein [Nocardia sp. CA-119907]|uniref:hypothetical protein n=1 Tax=Nocardia sp. CA-119907 TaxID=3239973 RepID=UPI003D9578A2